jgi:DNA-directed RNA polymerase specialized sigma24 family protein
MIDALATLPPKARVVVVMRYWAAVTSISAATNTAGPPIRVGGYPYAIVIAP